MLRQWVMPPLSDLVLIGLCGPIAAIGMTMLGQAYRLTEVNFVTSFEYTALIWGTLWGYVVWREVPGVSSVIGAVRIVLAGLGLLPRATRWRPGVAQRADADGVYNLLSCLPRNEAG